MLVYLVLAVLETHFYYRVPVDCSLSSRVSFVYRTRVLFCVSRWLLAWFDFSITNENLHKNYLPKAAQSFAHTVEYLLCYISLNKCFRSRKFYHSIYSLRSLTLHKVDQKMMKCNVHYINLCVSASLSLINLNYEQRKKPHTRKPVCMPLFFCFVSFLQ